MKRCEASSCNQIVNEKGRNSVHLRGRSFCCAACSQQHLASLGIRVIGNEPETKLPVVYNGH